MVKLTNQLSSWLRLPKITMTPFLWLLLLAPIMLWFSYQPVISLGGNASMNFELSLALIYCAVLAIAGLPAIWRERRKLIGSPIVWLAGLFLLWSALSIIWSANRTRGVLVVGITGVLYLILLALWAYRTQVRRLLPTLTRILLITTMVMCLWGLVQFIGGIWQVNRQNILLCLGCTASQFGFVRPNGFAIEPQFFGNLLILPILILARRLILCRWNWRNVAAFSLAILMLFLTLSRGAIYAVLIGLVIVAAIYWRQWRRSLGGVGLTLVIFAGSLIMQGTATVLNPRVSETFSGAVNKVVSQLSLGVVDFAKWTAAPQAPATNDKPAAEAPRYDGYVAESTDIRVNFSKVALAVWNQDWPNRLFGIGVGGAGVAMAEYNHNEWSKEIVQNEFVEVLMERGMIGLVLLLLLIGVVAYGLWHNDAKWVLAILVAYLAQYCFFSGLPNVLHVYVVLALLCALTGNHLPKRLE